MSYLDLLKHNAHQLFVAVDQVANVLVTFFTSPAWADETLSSRAWRAWRDGKVMGRIWRPIIDALFFWQKVRVDSTGHCHHAYLNERDRLHAPPETRSPK